MKYKKIVLFFCLTLPLSLLLRTLQLFFTVETDTGFFKIEYKTVGFYFLALIIAVCVSMAIICFTGHRNPEHPPKINPFIAVSSFLVVISIISSIFDQSFLEVVMHWQTTLLTISGVLAAIYFLLYGMSGFININLPPILSIFPSAYFIMKIISSFTAISSLALITDNILILAAYCVILLFLISFGKLYNGIDSEGNFRKLMASGFVSVILCFTQAVPHFIINFATDGAYLHTSNATSLSLLGFGIFIAAFTFSHFSLSNIKTVRTHKTSTTTDEKYFFI